MYRKSIKEEYYTLKAKQDKYPARSIYKLQQIDEKFNLIQKNDKILDLGCAPGSWLLYASKKIQGVPASTRGGEPTRGWVLGVDLQDITIPLPKNARFIKEDTNTFKTNEKFNVIISDMAPNTSGDHSVDVERSIELCETTLEIAKVNLNKGGNFLCKIFEGDGVNEFFKKVEQSFKFAKRYKPMASRKESREIYIIGIRFNG